MERNAILAKTAKGQAELKARTHALARMLRTALIMVDGSATAGDILAKCGGTPEVEAALESLVSQGFVEVRGAGPAAASPAAASAAAATPAAAGPAAPAAPVGATQPLPAPATPAPAPLGATQPLPSPAAPNAAPLGATQPLRAPLAPAQPREAAMAGLKRFLADNLESGSDALSGTLERAGTPADFHVAVERCAHALAAAQGASTAQAFRDRARAYLDAYLGGG